MQVLKFLRKANHRISAEKVTAKASLRRAQFAGALARLPNFATAIKETASIEGAIVEAGVGSGLSLATLALLNEVHNPRRAVIAFDSFRSFPTDYVDGDVSSPDENVSLLDHVKDNLAYANVDHSQIRFVEGYFSDTLPSYSGDPIAILHLDVDIGRSYSETLRAFWPHVVTGGVVIFDEYDNPKDLEKWPDAKPAIDQYFENEAFRVLDYPYLTRRMIVKI